MYIITKCERTQRYINFKNTENEKGIYSSPASGYLDGIDIVKMDYRDLFDKWKYYPNVVFIIDPPYLSTEVGTYECYWKLGNYLDVLQTVKNTSYFYFTSNKSQIIDLCDWIENNMNAENPFNGAERVDVESKIGYNSKYIDIMLYKKK